LSEVDRGLALDGFGPLLRATGLSAALAVHERTVLRARLDALLAGEPGVDLGRSLAALLDNRAAAHAELERAAAEADVVDRASLAEWVAYYGDPALALVLLAAVPPEHMLSNGLLWRPVLAEARKLPAFKDLARGLGLVDYWRAYGWPDACRSSDDDFVCQ
jgi:hypothetical protein